MAERPHTSKASRCSVAVDNKDPALPVAGTGRLSHVRKSRRSRWRAGVLIGVHALIAAHIAHFLIAGRTMSPLEPSEAMYTLELGYFNCGFLFFAVALLGTLVFGRFFCGWACHIVALQDLCAWVMKKLGIRPRPFRSRLLAFGPLVLALYMFAWPTFRRVVFGIPGAAPSLTNHLLTSGFWTTFPGPLFGMLTFLVCGFVAVYMLGAKGFCTYGCPYGAMFGALDALSPGRIVVSDACEQCGHCTATCTSNVRVHEEVKLYGMVVDTGCMKCMDCVSVCPKNALSYAIAKPFVLKGPPAGVRSRRYDLRLPEELLLGAVCFAATLTFRGLYDGPPLLMSIGLGAITAFLVHQLWQLVRLPAVRIQNLTLKAGGRLRTGGWIFATLGVLWLAFTAHSAFVQWHRAWGRYDLARTEASRADVLSATYREGAYSPRHARAAAEAFRHFSTADRWGLVDVLEIKLGLSWTELLRRNPERALAHARAAVALAPGQAYLYRNLYEVLMVAGRAPEAIEALRHELSLRTATPADRFLLAGLLADTNRLEEAAAEYAACVKQAPDSAEAHYDLGGVLRRMGRSEAAIAPLERARDLKPDDADTYVELGLAYMETGRRGEALAALRRAIALAPDAPESRYHLPGVIQQLEHPGEGAPSGHVPPG